MGDSAKLRRRGCVVGLLVLVLVAGLILPAIQRIRQQAAQMTCSNNQKQIGLGIHNYHDTYQRFPSLVDQGEGAVTANGLPSMYALLMPYLEASPGFFHEGWEPNQYHAHSNVMFPYSDNDGNRFVLSGGRVNRGWRLFLCPLDTTGRAIDSVPMRRSDGSINEYGKGARDVPMALPDGSTGYYAVGSYAANGMLPWGRGKLDSITAGTSNTIMLAERPQVCRTASGETIYNLWGVGFYSPHMPAFATLTPTEPAGLWSTGQVAPVSPLPSENATESIRFRIGRVDAVPEVPDFTKPFQMLRKDQPCDPRLPGTLHRSAMSVAMADASVRTFSSETTPWVFWTACVPTKPTDPTPP